MKKKWFVVFIMNILVVISLAGGCGEREKGRSVKETRETITVSGSGTLSPLFEKFKEVFEKEHPKYFVKILPGTNTGGGIKGVKEKIIDVGLCSRALKPDEQRLGLRYVLLARDELFFAVNTKVTGIKQLTPQQVRDIYQGKITNWKQLGGNALPIVVLDRDENEAVKETLRREILGSALKIRSDAVVLMHSLDMDKTLVSMPGAIGYTGKGEIKVQKLLLTPINIKGYNPRPEYIRSGKYKLFIEIGIVVLPDMKDKVKLFFDFITGSKGQAIMEQNGYIVMGGP